MQFQTEVLRSPSTGELLTERQAAAYLAISLSTLRRWRKTGSGPAYIRFGSLIRYAQSALDKYIEMNTTTGGEGSCQEQQQKTA